MDVLTVPSCQLSPFVSTGFEWQPQLLVPAHCLARSTGVRGAGRGCGPFLGLFTTEHLGPPGEATQHDHACRLAAHQTAQQLFRAWCWFPCPLPKEEGNEDTLPPRRQPGAPRPQKGQ